MFSGWTIPEKTVHVFVNCNWRDSSFKSEYSQVAAYKQMQNLETFFKCSNHN